MAGGALLGGLVRAVQANGPGAVGTGRRLSAIDPLSAGAPCTLIETAAQLTGASSNPAQACYCGTGTASRGNLTRRSFLNLLVVQVEAEEVDDLAERYEVSAVPHFLIFKVPDPFSFAPVP